MKRLINRSFRTGSGDLGRKCTPSGGKMPPSGIVTREGSRFKSIVAVCASVSLMPLKATHKPEYRDRAQPFKPYSRYS